MTRFIAQQVATDHLNPFFSEVPFQAGKVYGDVLIAGNEKLKPVGHLQNELKKWMDNFNAIEDASYRKNGIKTLKSLFPHGSDKLDDYARALVTRDREDILTAVTGRPYQSWNFFGPAEEDIQYLYTPTDASWTRGKVNKLADMYWDTGTEWEIWAVDINPEELSNDFPFDMYTSASDNEAVKRGVANELRRKGVSVDVAVADNITLERIQSSNANLTMVADSVDREHLSKQDFIKELGALFVKYGVSQIRKLDYVQQPGSELVNVTDGDGIYLVDITGDSTLAIVYDIVKAIWRH